MFYSILMPALLSMSVGFSWSTFTSFFSSRRNDQNSELTLIMTASPVCITVMALSVSDFGWLWSSATVTSGWMVSSSTKGLIRPMMMLTLSAFALVAYVRIGRPIAI
ncbi:hypothetical protein [Ochrobactrum teleogrylli]|uniref:hypothetical protein n=1 Tax=Ochrobactrum teleogrylli TaxID=2479765 RepID=UPI00384C6983|nr:hypothetical protein [Agrobacterium sp. S2]